MEFITIVYLTYSFIAFYFLFLFIIIYTQNRKEFYSYPKPKKEFTLSIIVPCYNEQTTIVNTIKSITESTYKGLKKIIVVDDCSTDNSYKIIKEYAKKYPNVIAKQTPKNTGCAAGSKNFGAKFADTELIGFSDADSSPQPNAIEKMIGFFNNHKTGAVTSRVLVKNRKKLFGKIQSIEYKVIAFTRKLLGFIGSIYVTNGPLSIYRKSAFDKVRGFDQTNLTEDIEITWHMVSRGYKIHMCIPAKIYTIVPDTMKTWFKQRTRWNIGGIQTLIKYKKKVLNTGMLGKFILPYFILAWVLGLTGFVIVVYRIIRRFIISYLTTKYSIASETAIITFQDINLPLNILLFFGLLLFFLSLLFTFIAILHSKEKEFKNYGILTILIYGIVYLMLYPPLLVTSVYKYTRKKYSW